MLNVKHIMLRLAGGLCIGLAIAGVMGCGQSNPELIFVIAGQSNAVGVRMQASGPLPPSSITKLDDVAVLYATGGSDRPRQAEVWLPLSDVPRQDRYRLGPEFGAAIELRDQFEKRLGIVKVGFNGTPLASVPGDDWHPDSSGELYSRLVSSIEGAAFGNRSPTSACVAGLFWIQGESDAKSSGPGRIPPQPSAADGYRDNLTRLLRTFRARFGEQLPVVVAALGVPAVDRDGRHFDYRSQVLAAQESVAARLPAVTLVSVEGLERGQDALHFSASGQLELGRRLGRAMLELLRQQQNPKLSFREP